MGEGVGEGKEMGERGLSTGEERAKGRGEGKGQEREARRGRPGGETWRGRGMMFHVEQAMDARSWGRGRAWRGEGMMAGSGGIWVGGAPNSGFLGCIWSMSAPIAGWFGFFLLGVSSSPSDSPFIFPVQPFPYKPARVPFGWGEGLGGGILGFTNAKGIWRVFI